MAVHIDALENFFLPFLGPRFLREFYQSFGPDPMGIGSVAVAGEACREVVNLPTHRRAGPTTAQRTVALLSGINREGNAEET